MKKYSGVIVPISTPVDEHERVDEKGLRRLIDHCIEKGLHGIFVCGTNGECLGLTQEERNRAIRIALEHAAGRIPVLAGCMDSSTRRVIDNIKALEQMGGQAAVVTPEFYSRHSSPAETVRHFENIAKHTAIDVFAYNIPPFTGTTITPGMLSEIAQFDHIVGFKDTSAQFGDFLHDLERFRGTDFMIFQGKTQHAPASVLLGTDGFIPSIGPLVPELCLKVWELARGGEVERLKAYARLLLEACDAVGKAKNSTAAVKAACGAMLGFDGRMCLPSESVEGEKLSQVLNALRGVEEKRLRLEG